MALAFHITETMSGLHCFVDPSFGGPEEREWSFRVTWGSPVGDTARRAITGKPLEHSFSGDVSVGGLTRGETPCEGTLTLDYPRRRITYELGFDVGGARYTIVAEKRDVDLRRPLQLVKTHTTAYGTLRDAEGRVVSRGVLHFRPETMGDFVRSFRVARG